MKTVILIVAGSLISFLTLLLIGLVILNAKPEYFGVVAQPAKPGHVATTDSTKHSVPDSVRAGVAQVSAGQAIDHNDSLLVSRLKQHADSLEHQVDSLHQTLKSPAKNIVSDDQHDWTATAKLMESMNAEDAGKILKQMKDVDVKQILSKIKKKQAGKILSVLDPTRAARILR